MWGGVAGEHALRAPGTLSFAISQICGVASAFSQLHEYCAYSDSLLMRLRRFTTLTTRSAEDLGA